MSPATDRWFARVLRSPKRSRAEALERAHTGPHPPLAAGGYVRHREMTLVDLARPDFLRWVNDPELELGDLLHSDDDSTRVVGTELLRGTWDPAVDRTGHRRRIRFADGHRAVEEVLADSPAVFRYLVWGFTDARRRRVLDHATAAFEFEDLGNRTRVTWTYALRPRTPLLRPLIARFVDRTVAGLMRDTLAVMKRRSEAEARS